jgi:formylglycine-generating enzyme required for sulfatase activity
MIYIPPGPFLMGDADDAAHYFADNPRHSVTLSGYYLYKNDVTVAMYQKFCTADRLTPSREAA